LILGLPLRRTGRIRILSDPVRKVAVHRERKDERRWVGCAISINSWREQALTGTEERDAEIPSGCSRVGQAGTF
jgi:hypothetical protein